MINKFTLSLLKQFHSWNCFYLKLSALNFIVTSQVLLGSIAADVTTVK